METRSLIAILLCGVIALTGFAFLAWYVWATSGLNEDKVRNQNPCAVWIARAMFVSIWFLVIDHLLEIV